MTASIATARPLAAPSTGRFAGLRALLRKDTTDWIRGRRAPIAFVISTAFMVLTAANAWINAQIREALPPDVAPPPMPLSMAPLDNLLTAIGAQVFVLIAIFAVTSLIVRERESGTLAWLASKPISRSSIWISKWITSSAILVIAAVLAPLAVTVLVVVALYGVPDPVAVASIALGASALVVFFAALGLAAGTVMPGQPAIAATGFAVFALVPILAALVPFPIEPYLPTAILGWSVGLASGAEVGWLTPFAWAVGTAALGWFAVNRMRRLEL